MCETMSAHPTRTDRVRFVGSLARRWQPTREGRRLQRDHLLRRTHLPCVVTGHTAGDRPSTTTAPHLQTTAGAQVINLWLRKGTQAISTWPVDHA
ncbi:hypothetical protein [Streptomyces roseoverticillatus]|uniref:hypothetical protein n=1 Tax=Streptomyces roseoverticillatus TaxID=66429 RepID=UPI0012FF4720|nr:hypothetical protein [Streptomyces roseoverticillatus]